MSEAINHDPLAAASVAFMTATLATGMLAIGTGSWRFFTIPTLASPPAWAWMGGLLGACHVMISMRVVLATGATALLVLVIASSLIGASICNHIGAFGLSERPFGMVRLAGVMIVLIGVLITVGA